MKRSKYSKLYGKPDHRYIAFDEYLRKWVDVDAEYATVTMYLGWDGKYYTCPQG